MLAISQAPTTAVTNKRASLVNKYKNPFTIPSKFTKLIKNANQQKTLNLSKTILPENYFSSYNTLKFLGNDKLGVVGFPIIVKNKNGSSFIKFFLDDKNANNNSNTHSFYEYNILKKITDINRNNNYKLPFVKTHDYKRAPKQKILDLIRESNLLKEKDKEEILEKLTSIFGKTSSEKIGFYKMDNIEDSITFEKILMKIDISNIKSLIFQSYNGLLKVKEVYPKFVHNDLHLFNIIVVKNPNPNESLETNYDGRVYKLDLMIYKAYIIDFDQSLIDDEDNKSIHNTFKYKDQNYDELYMILYMLIIYFNNIIPKLNLGIDIGIIKRRYLELKNKNKYNNKYNVAFKGKEMMMYLVLFYIFDEYLYDSNNDKFMNKKYIDIPKVVFDVFNMYNKVFNIATLLTFSLFHKHQGEIFREELSKGTLDILLASQDKAIQKYELIYEMKAKYLEKSVLTMKYAYDPEFKTKPMMREDDVIRVLFGDLLKFN